MLAAAPVGARATSVSENPYRVMVVDDSATIRGLLTRALEQDAEIAVVASAADGEMALNQIARHPVEVVVLDIEMPKMDGLTALPRLLAERPGLQVVMASTLTRHNAEISLKALSLGAADYVTKPMAGALISAEEFKADLLRKVKQLGLASRRTAGRQAPTAPRQPSVAAAPTREVATPPIALRRAAAEPPIAVAIASSTGGPQALFTLLGAMRGLTQPVFLTQHMPATFTTILAEHIQRTAGWPAAEAVDGAAPVPGHVHVAPGDFHLVVNGEGSKAKVRLSKDPPENFCRPAADPMLRSLVAAYGSRLLAVVLTGMGHDGLAGCRQVVAAGGTVVAQDEATSVVWGMPGAVALAGLCSAVLPLPELGRHIVRIARSGGGR
jgi:two-component system, chemotaxis family, protein-glutamate methylesterase/glutaminase